MSMFDHKFARDRELYQMVAENPRIRKSIMNFVYKVISMVHAERFDPVTVKLLALSPAGENDKIAISLLSAEYSTKPVVEPTIVPGDASYRLTSFVGSLYKALMENNNSTQGFFHVCPELATFTYVVATRILEYYYFWQRRDFSKVMSWDCFDHWDSGDLMIVGYIPDCPV